MKKRGRRKRRKKKKKRQADMKETETLEELAAMVERKETEMKETERKGTERKTTMKALKRRMSMKMRRRTGPLLAG
jgi:hypothetical protein